VIGTEKIGCATENFFKKVLDNLLKSAILKLPKERKTTAESATVNLLGFQEKKNWSKKIKNP
jgi:hypothetical protein